MDTIIATGNILLELSRAPAHVLQPALMLLGEPGYDAANAADGLVNNVAVAFPEFRDRGRVGGKQRVGRHKPCRADQRKLIRLGVVGGRGREWVDDERRRD